MVCMVMFGLARVAMLSIYLAHAYRIHTLDSAIPWKGISSPLLGILVCESLFCLHPPIQVLVIHRLVRTFCPLVSAFWR